MLQPPPIPDRRRRGWRALRVAHVIAPAVIIPIGAVMGYGQAAGVVALFMIVTPFEKMFRRHDQKPRRPGLKTDLTYALVNGPLNVFGTIMAIGLALLFFPIYLPALLIEGVLLADISIYWAHRLPHDRRAPLTRRSHPWARLGR